MHLQEARLAFTLSCNTDSADSGRKTTAGLRLKRSAKQQGF